MYRQCPAISHKVRSMAWSPTYQLSLAVFGGVVASRRQTSAELPRCGVVADLGRYNIQRIMYRQWPSDHCGVVANERGATASKALTTMHQIPENSIDSLTARAASTLENFTCTRHDPGRHPTFSARSKTNIWVSLNEPLV